MKPRYDEMSADYAGGTFWNKGQVQLRFSRPSIFHNSPLLKTIQLSQFLSELQLWWLKLKKRILPTNPRSIFFHIWDKKNFKGLRMIKMGENGEN